jgi:hypothetical protein
VGRLNSDILWAESTVHAVKLRNWRLSSQLNWGLTENASVGGLLHDLGKAWTITLRVHMPCWVRNSQKRIWRDPLVVNILLHTITKFEQRSIEAVIVEAADAISVHGLLPVVKILFLFIK